MAQNFSAQLGNLVVNDSNWQPVNVLNNLTSDIPPSGNLEYSTWNSSLEGSNYTYLRYSRELAQPLDQASNALDYYFRPDTFTYPAHCTYPISGQYGFMNRLLFYILIIFALAMRRRFYLAAAALGTAMTYAASAAVHAFALLVRYNYSISIETAGQPPLDAKASDYGDLDLAGIFPILVAGCIMVTPILNWSVGIRENARALTVCWGLLIFTAAVPTFERIWKGVLPVSDVDQLVTCSVDTSNNCTLQHVAERDNFARISLDYYNRCNCNDTCGAVSLPNAPFRKGQNLQAYLVKDTTIRLLDRDSVYWAGAVDAFFLCFVLGYGFLGLLEFNFTQAELRNKMFLLLGGKTPHSDRRRFTSKARYYLAKATSSFFFMLAVVAAVTCPAVFISSVIINEIYVWGYPVSENSDAVGQWSTYVGTVFVILAAIIQRYHLAWGHALYLLYVKTKHLFARDTTRCISMQTKVPKTKSNSVLENISAFFIQIARPLTRAGRSVARSWRRVKEEWEDFKLWWRDPIYRSTQPHYRGPRDPSMYHMLPLQRSATLPHSSSSFSVNSPKRPTIATSPLSETLLSPPIPSTSRLVSPQLVADPVGHSYFDDPSSPQDAIERHTFERRASGL